jgi:glycosyltransferase involved in cell wall biosynthesis
MKISFFHNYYQFAGGEDQVFQAEQRLLQTHGHQVFQFIRRNDEIKNYSGFGKLQLAFRTIYHKKIQDSIRQHLQQAQPDVVHVHNFFPLISPALYDVCREMQIPVIQTLHNYRLVCPNAYLYRNGQICEACLEQKSLLSGVKWGCYRNSRVQSAVVAGMVGIHRRINTWQNKIDNYIALTEFARQKFIQGELPAGKIQMKPNFINPDPGKSDLQRENVVFVGRLSVEKGIITLIDAWKNNNTIPLKIIGDGPQQTTVSQLVHKNLGKNIELLGRLPTNPVIAQMQQAKFLIFPSEWYEGMPMTILEAFACGTPVVASRLGAMAEIVDDGRTGLLFKPGDADDLAAKVEWAWSHEKQMLEMGKAARKEYELKYTAERNYAMLMDIYQQAIDNKNR